jgi:hypothetical protein
MEDVSVQTIHRWIHNHDIVKIHLDPEFLTEKHREEYKGPTEIAENEVPYEVSPATVYNALDRHNIVRKHKDEDWLREKYVEEGLSASAVADECGVCAGTVLNNLKKKGIDVVSISNRWEQYEHPFTGEDIEDLPIPNLSGEDNPMFGVTGSDHPLYSGGGKWRDSAEWYFARELALELDDYTCQHCGSESDLHVHHMCPVSRGGDKYSQYNLMVLCQDCHISVHSEYYAKNSEENEYQGEWISEDEAPYA